MTIDQKIENVCMSIGNISYYFGDWTRANVELETVALPVLINLIPMRGSSIIKNGTLRESRNGMFALLDKSGNDELATQDAATIARMREQKNKLLLAFNQSGFFNPIEGEIADEVVIDKLDIVITGVIFELKLTEKNGRCTG